MSLKDLVILLLTGTSLDDEDFFTSAPFYYLANFRPDFHIRFCVDAVEFIRDSFRETALDRHELLEQVKETGDELCYE